MRGRTLIHQAYVSTRTVFHKNCPKAAPLGRCLFRLEDRLEVKLESIPIGLSLQVKATLSVLPKPNDTLSPAPKALNRKTPKAQHLKNRTHPKP